jgi:hypothetical protein
MSEKALSAPTRLMNVDQAIPEEFYIFVNQLLPTTAHNFRFTRTFASAGVTTASLSTEGMRKYLSGELNFVPYYPRDLGELALSPFLVSATADYSVEYDADYWRARINPLYPSRLSALYAFGDYESCLDVNRKHGWPLDSVRQFRLKPLPITRVVKVNMEVVSLMRHAKRVSSLPPDDPTPWQHYWSGSGNLRMELPGPEFKRVIHDSDVIWEYLIEGVAELVPGET